MSLVLAASLLPSLGQFPLMHLFVSTLGSSDPSKIVQEYILPRFSISRSGRVKANDEMSNPDDDVVNMGTERFAVSELLFRPSDIGEPSLLRPHISTSSLHFHLLLEIAMIDIKSTLSQG